MSGNIPCEYDEAIKLMLLSEFWQAEQQFRSALQLAQAANNSELETQVFAQLARNKYFQLTLAVDAIASTQLIIYAKAAKDAAAKIETPYSEEATLAVICEMQAMLISELPDRAYGEGLIPVSQIQLENEKSMVRLCMAAYFGLAAAQMGLVGVGARWVEVSYTHAKTIQPDNKSIVDLNYDLCMHEILICRLRAQLLKGNQEGAQNTHTSLVASSDRFIRAGLRLPADLLTALKAELHI